MIEKCRYRKFIILLLISFLTLFIFYQNHLIEVKKYDNEINLSNNIEIEKEIMYSNDDVKKVVNDYPWLSKLEFDISLIENFKKCQKTVIFSLENYAGIGHIINVQLSIMTWSYFTNRTFFIDDNNWNYGKWSNYFSQESFIHTKHDNIYQILYNNINKCILPDVENITDMFENMDISHLKVKDWWVPLTPIYNFNKQYETHNLTNILKYEKLFKIRSKLLNDFWILQPKLRNIVEKKIKKIGNFISIHIRRGDKIKELDNNNYVPLINFYKNIQKIFDDNKYPYINSKNTSILVISDNINIIHDLKKDKPNWNFVTTWPINSNLYIKNEFEQSIINREPDVVRQAYGIGFIIEIEMMKHSEFVICTYSSNVCRLIAQLRGWDDSVVNKKVISLDIEWYPQGT